LTPSKTHLVLIPSYNPGTQGSRGRAPRERSGGNERDLPQRLGGNADGEAVSMSEAPDIFLS
jgi:hypothetical protein